MTDEAPLVPWIACPEIPYPSIGWRMGEGQEAYDKFWIWFSSLTDTEAGTFATKHPEPEDWRGKYAQIRANPWSGHD